MADDIEIASLPPEQSGPAVWLGPDMARRSDWIVPLDATRKRHLLRLWLAPPGARALPPAFAARYGSLTVGDRGGISVPGMAPTVSLTPN